MRKYVVVDKETGVISCVMQWADNRDLPVDYPVEITNEIYTIDAEADVQYGDIYDFTRESFYILDVSDEEIEIQDIDSQLQDLELVLSDFQEVTWSVLGVVEANLPQLWQDRLRQKRDLRTRLAELGGNY